MNIKIVCPYLGLIILCFLPVTNSLIINEEDCCQYATGICKELCEQIPVLADAENENFSVHQLKQECPFQMGSFWKCMNKTSPTAISSDDISKDLWFGTFCCNLSRSYKCENACVNANSIHGIKSGCRRSDEVELYDCIIRQQAAQNCCTNTQNAYCYNTCKQIFQDTLRHDEETLKDVINYCSETDPSVLLCVKNYTHESTVINLHKYSHCCEMSSNRHCKNTCHQHIHITATDRRIISSLQTGGCGDPSFHDPFWQCFLQSTDSNANTAAASAADSTELKSQIKTVGMDSAKLHCCFSAATEMCRNLCLKTYSNEWSSTSDHFIRECLSFSAEEKLQYCLNDVEEPCELGCSGLNYCSNFNRPTEFFRSCNPESDNAAREDVASWQSQGFINIFGFQLPFLNITQCNPAVWKTFACILQIKPCQQYAGVLKFCRDDCIELLENCLDWRRISPDLSVRLLCSRFDYVSSENFNASCISVKKFLQPIKTADKLITNQLTIPCRNSECDRQDVCLINRNCFATRHQKCSIFQCVEGCQLGDISEYTVPVGTHVRLPIVTENANEICHRICRCSANNVIKHCQTIPCTKPESCVIDNDRKIAHGSQLLVGESTCACYAGEIICTKKHCNCITNHFSVCGSNGRTYLNSCFAKCDGLTLADFTLGECSSERVCDRNHCTHDEECVPERKVCFLNKQCPQYQCVPKRSQCGHYPIAPVCDDRNEEHKNLCHLVKKRRKLAYNGPCLKTCNKYDIVCGTDGNTYESECVANANFVHVDYEGPCVSSTVGHIDHSYCVKKKVKCRILPDETCQQIIPSGACCPVCAGAFIALYSKKQIEKITYKRGHSVANIFTVHNTMKALQRHIQMADCVIRGHLTVESDLLVMVMPTKIKVTSVYFQICTKEAEKLATMIKTGSPRILSELSLSILTGAIVLPDTCSTSASFHISHSLFMVPYFSLMSTLLIIALFL